ncbi:MAG: hypothetical protein KGI73_03835 [Patescibacteria group bacterium]|nr:hypothetical protein [Patescibacteria group bacterium]
MSQQTLAERIPLELASSGLKNLRRRWSMAEYFKRRKEISQERKKRASALRDARKTLVQEMGNVSNENLETATAPYEQALFNYLNFIAETQGMDMALIARQRELGMFGALWRAQHKRLTATGVVVGGGLMLKIAGPLKLIVGIPAGIIMNKLLHTRVARAATRFLYGDGSSDLQEGDAAIKNGDTLQSLIGEKAIRRNERGKYVGTEIEGKYAAAAKRVKRQSQFRLLSSIAFGFGVAQSLHESFAAALIDHLGLGDILTNLGIGHWFIHGSGVAETLGEVARGVVPAAAAAEHGAHGWPSGGHWGSQTVDRFGSGWHQPPSVGRGGVPGAGYHGSQNGPHYGGYRGGRQHQWPGGRQNGQYPWSGQPGGRQGMPFSQGHTGERGGTSGATDSRSGAHWVGTGPTATEGYGHGCGCTVHPTGEPPHYDDDGRQYHMYDMRTEYGERFRVRAPWGFNEYSRPTNFYWERQSNGVQVLVVINFEQVNVAPPPPPDYTPTPPVEHATHQVCTPDKVTHTTTPVEVTNPEKTLHKLGTHPFADTRAEAFDTQHIDKLLAQYGAAGKSPEFLKAFRTWLENEGKLTHFDSVVLDKHARFEEMANVFGKDGHTLAHGVALDTTDSYYAEHGTFTYTEADGTVHQVDVYVPEHIGNGHGCENFAIRDSIVHTDTTPGVCHTEDGPAPDESGYPTSDQPYDDQPQ